MYLRENPSSTRSEIRENFERVQESVFNNALERMAREGVIYSSSSLDDRYSAV
jgi:CRISPR/Cas system-associated endoribonuclease Cas2